MFPKCYGLDLKIAKVDGVKPGSVSPGTTLDSRWVFLLDRKKGDMFLKVVIPEAREKCQRNLISFNCLLQLLVI